MRTSNGKPLTNDPSCDTQHFHKIHPLNLHVSNVPEFTHYKECTYSYAHLLHLTQQSLSLLNGRGVCTS